MNCDVLGRKKPDVEMSRKSVSQRRPGCSSGPWGELEKVLVIRGQAGFQPPPAPIPGIGCLTV